MFWNILSKIYVIPFHCSIWLVSVYFDILKSMLSLLTRLISGLHLNQEKKLLRLSSIFYGFVRNCLQSVIIFSYFLLERGRSVETTWFGIHLYSKSFGHLIFFESVRRSSALPITRGKGTKLYNEDRKQKAKALAKSVKKKVNCSNFLLSKKDLETFKTTIRKSNCTNQRITSREPEPEWQAGK